MNTKSQVCSFFQNAKSEQGTETIPTGIKAYLNFTDEYWNTSNKEICTFEGMGAWYVDDHEDNMNFINRT